MATYTAKKIEFTQGSDKFVCDPISKLTKADITALGIPGGVINSLDSTSTTDALSAAQGKALNSKITAYKKDTGTLADLKSDLVTFTSGLSTNDVRPYAFWASSAFSPFEAGHIYNGDIRILNGGTNSRFVVVFEDEYGKLISVAYDSGTWTINAITNDIATLVSQSVTKNAPANTTIASMVAETLGKNITKRWYVSSPSTVSDWPNDFSDYRYLYPIIEITNYSSIGEITIYGQKNNGTPGVFHGHYVSNTIHWEAISSISDCNSITTTGIYKTSNSTSNTPVTGYHYIIHHVTYASGEMYQIAERIIGGQLWSRSYASGSWNSWKKIIREDNVIGVPDYSNFTYLVSSDYTGQVLDVSITANGYVISQFSSGAAGNDISYYIGIPAAGTTDEFTLITNNVYLPSSPAYKSFYTTTPVKSGMTLRYYRDSSQGTIKRVRFVPGL